MERKLESRVSVLVIVEGAALIKLDRLAGAGNRSAYIRYLIDTVDGTEARKYIELEAQVRLLEKLPKIQGERISKLELKVEQLKNINKQLVTGKPVDLKDLPGVKEAVAFHKIWLNNLLGRHITITRAKEIDRIRITAKNLGVSPEALLDEVHLTLNVKGIDVNKLGAV